MKGSFIFRPREESGFVGSCTGGCDIVVVVEDPSSSPVKAAQQLLEPPHHKCNGLKSELNSSPRPAARAFSLSQRTCCHCRIPQCDDPGGVRDGRRAAGQAYRLLHQLPALQRIPTRQVNLPCSALTIRSLPIWGCSALRTRGSAPSPTPRLPP